MGKTNTSPTETAQLYCIPMVETSVAKQYECRLSSPQHFVQIIQKKLWIAMKTMCRLNTRHI